MTEVRYVDIGIREFSEEDFDHVKTVEVPYDNPIIIDISELTTYKIEIKVTMKDPYGRETEGVIETQTDILGDPDGKEGSNMLPIVMTVMIVLILLVLASLLFIERTSYVIQSSIFKGGDVLEEEVVKPIQDHPGITFTELMKELDVERKDLLTTINHLEAKGMARSVDDGLRIRFYPMMGSFVDGPLALNRFQEKILEIMYRTRNLDLRELSDASGFPRKNLERELEKLMLKGAVEKMNGDNGTAYNLTRKMKARMRRSKRT
jgi:predicted transcriptional regulator